MPKTINVADLIDPNDPQGRSYREVNTASQHQYPVGSLVEINWPENPKRHGVRLFVTKHSRDCDGTPLYVLGFPAGDHPPDCRNKLFIDGGYGAESLKLVKS